jgi:hypothetical protein
MASTNDKETAKLLLKSYEGVFSALQKVQNELASLKAREEKLLNDMSTILDTFKLLKADIYPIKIPPELLFKRDASIGDSIEQLLREHGDMKKIEVSKELQKAGKIATKNARIILTNAIKRDARKRFTVKDGRVFLNEK